MGSVKQVKVNRTAPQQGFILALSLLMMLFVGLVVITGTQRTGTEQRVAISELHTASVQAAAEAGLYRLRNQLKIACKGLSDPNACATKLKESLSSNAKIAELLDLGEDTLGVGISNDRRIYDADNEFFWWIPVICPEIIEGNNSASLTVLSYGEAGLDPTNPRQRAMVSARIKIDMEDLDEGGPDTDDSNDEVLSAKEVLSDLFGQFSAITQAANLQGSGKIFGDVAATSEPKITGGSTFDGNYSEITTDAYDAHRDVVNSYFNTFSTLGYSNGTLNVVPALGGYPFRDSQISPDGWHGFNQTWNINDWQQFNLTLHQNQEFMGQEVTVIPLSELNIASDARIEVKGGNVVLYVDGDVGLAGNARFTIGSKSSLTLVMTGQFTLQGSFSFAYLDEETGVITSGNQMDSRVLNENGYPIFSVYTSYVQSGNNDQGVRVQGNTNLYGVIYAANSDVRITGSGDVWGSVFGNNVDVEGNASIRFAAEGVGGDLSNDDDEEPPSTSATPSPTLDSEFDYEFPEHLLECTAP
ncbi:MAG: hypothetical protein IBX50_18695 [Marinospirillum sp.]|uniref:DUF7305 domain-containing protein n=1 Tax=Marinospirillum sp. TaxID=2183934 RepID=UPI0019F80E13|nr:hypothetical protein [Marinospirillum sp.]MBE0508717.1 hypothetical protein [Marinospirillum sp.]